MIVFQQGDWAINKTDAKFGVGPDFDGVCLRHMSCTAHDNPKDGQCSCTGKWDNEDGHCACNGGCWNCKTKVPEDVKGFFALVKWKR